MHLNSCTSGEAHIVPAEEIGPLYKKAAESGVWGSTPMGVFGVLFQFPIVI
jgi:hypothetical protein